jgi:purine-binding chemotaxis protein CheW
MSVAEILETTQYLTFELEDEVFALDISKVREVLDFTTITKVPRTPDFMRGSSTSRQHGACCRYAVEIWDDTNGKDGQYLYYHCRGNAGRRYYGSWSACGFGAEVMDLEPDQIEPAPKIGARLKTEFIKGMGKHDNKFIMILDIDKAFSSDELSLVQSAGGRVPIKEEAKGCE